MERGEEVEVLKSFEISFLHGELPGRNGRQTREILFNTEGTENSEKLIFK